MRATVIDCAGCGAPLGQALAQAEPDGLVPCLYCGALLRFGAAGSEVAPVVERQLSPEVLAEAREAALRGGRERAIAVCVEKGGVSPAAAAVAVDDVIKSVANKAVLSQTLNAMGWTLALGSIACVLGGLAILLWPSPARLLGLAFLGFGALNLLVLGPGIRTSLRFAVATPATALIRKSIDVGPTGFSDGCRVFSLAIDVTPDRGPTQPFHARLVVPVRPQSLTKIQEGKRIAVRFADGGAWLRSDPERQVS